MASWSKWLFYWLFLIACVIYCGFWVISRVFNYCYVNVNILCIIYVNGNISIKSDLVLSERHCGFVVFVDFCSFLKGATVNSVNQVWMLCSYVWLCELCLSFSSGEPQNKSRSPCNEVPCEGRLLVWLSSCECLIHSLSSLSFVAFQQGATKTRPTDLHPSVPSVFRYWPFPLHFSFWPPLPIVHVLQEPVWTKANTNIYCNAPQPIHVSLPSFIQIVTFVIF